MTDENEVRTLSRWEDLPVEFQIEFGKRGFRREDWEQQSLVWRETYVEFAHDVVCNVRATGPK